MMKAKIIRLSRQVHQYLMYLSLFAVVTFVISAFTHPLMVWTGPQSVTFMPPKMTIDGNTVSNIPSTLVKLGIQESIVTKLVQTESGIKLQITENELQSRRYFSLIDGKEFTHYDEQQAEWLARYYTQQTAAVKDIAFITEFSTEYSWVNRLLPVYKVTFDTEDELTAYVYTETNALASLNNNWKRFLQGLFQTFHTWSWLDDVPLIRILLVSVLLLSLLSMLNSGLVMLISLKRKRYTSTAQSLHRKLAWIVFLPMLGFTLSGAYHLYQYEFAENQRGMRLGKPLQLKDFKSDQSASFTLHRIIDVSEESLNSFSLIKHLGRYYYRAGFSNHVSQNAGVIKPHEHHGASDKTVRNKRFDGVSKERSAKYYLLGGIKLDEASLTDKDVAKQLAFDFLDLDENTKVDLSKVTRFGPEYDFRNKRLPVWKITVTETGERIFVDPVTGILVDYVVNHQRYEGYSFSLLHKWNFLMAFMKRETRDYVIVSFLALIMVLATLGFMLRKSSNRNS